MKKTRMIFRDQDVHVLATTLRELIRRDVRRLDTNPSYASIDMESIWRGCLKKFTQPKSSEALSLKAYSLFEDINRHMARVQINYPNVERFSTMFNTQEMNYLVCARRWCHVILDRFTIEEWFAACKNSGGSSIGVPYSDTSIERKFKRPISVTPEAKDLYLNSISHNPRMWDAVMKHNGLPVTRRGCKEKLFNVVESSRATTVPKNDEISRMIAIEPTGNMYLQQGLMALMYDRLRSVGLDVAKLPSRHRHLAKEASIDGSLATIDFSSASDCVSIELLRYLLPKQWFQCLDRVRCKAMSISGTAVHLNMVSTMGNATTFPLETLVFYALGRAVENVETNSSTLPQQNLRTRISVFGDDCIIPTPLAEPFMGLCRSVGFIVNQEKSFFSPGPGFRESCGGDFLHGIDVRPLFFKWPSSQKGSGLKAWLYNMYNNLVQKYILYFQDCRYYYMPALRYLREKIASLGQTMLVPPDMPSDSGYHGIDSRILREHTGIAPRVDIHGTVVFHYLRFVYFDKQRWNDEIRLQLWLKQHHSRRCLKWSPQVVDEDPFFPIRSRGSYVVAKSQSAHWAL